jgi:ABC-type bacteriocin/lantibiotic exporter with double-glycine peptidase domain
LEISKRIERISFDDLSFSFGSSQKPLFIGIDFEFQKGESYWIKGVPGSGKSTLLKIFMEKMKTDKGSFKKGDFQIGYFASRKLRTPQ